MLNYTIINPTSFGGLQNYITSSNTNLFTMPSGRPTWGTYSQFFGIEIFYCKNCYL